MKITGPNLQLRSAAAEISRGRSSGHCRFTASAESPSPAQTAHPHRADSAARCRPAHQQPASDPGPASSETVLDRWRASRPPPAESASQNPPENRVRFRSPYARHPVPPRDRPAIAAAWMLDNSARFSAKNPRRSQTLQPGPVRFPDRTGSLSFDMAVIVPAKAGSREFRRAVPATASLREVPGNAARPRQTSSRAESRSARATPQSPFHSAAERQSRAVQCNTEPHRCDRSKPDSQVPRPIFVQPRRYSISPIATGRTYEMYREIVQTAVIVEYTGE